MSDALILGYLAAASTYAALLGLAAVAHVLVWVALGPEGDEW